MSLPDMGDGMEQYRFDREPTLAELLAGLDTARLLAALEALLDRPLRLTDAEGKTLLGKDLPHAVRRVPVCVDMEPLGFLESAAPQQSAAAGAQLLEMILRSAARYRMAADLHLATVRDDYDELQRRHDALQVSEARYRELATTLEQRVAEQVQALDSTRRQLYHAEKLMAVGQLAAGVAHEINNPMGFITSNLSTAQTYLEKLAGYARRIALQESAPLLQQAWRDGDMDYVLEDFSALVQESLEGARRVTRIVADLKGFSRVDSVAVTPTDVNEIIRGVCNVTRNLTEGRVEVMLQLSPLPPLVCNGAALGQVFYNLLINAVQAMPGRKDARVRIASIARDEGIEVTVADNGPGISAEVLPRIFEPFFTTKEVGKGTGLGLTVCTDIIESHRGRLTVKSAIGAGAEFTAYLPFGG